jgi:hypothetical protein
VEKNSSFCRGTVPQPKEVDLNYCEKGDFFNPDPGAYGKSITINALGYFELRFIAKWFFSDHHIC